MSEPSSAVEPARPASLDERLRYAHELSQSRLLPREYRDHPQNVLVAIDTGEMLRIPAMAALHNIHIIEGTPTMSAALLVALVRRAGHRFRVRGDEQRAVAELVRSDDPTFTYRVAWTPRDAVTAGLCQLRHGRPYARDARGNPLPWERYPASLLKARAASQVCRDGAQDVFFGPVYVPEELGSSISATGIPTSTQDTMDTAVDWEAELAHLAGDHAGLRRLWREAMRQQRPREFLDRITRLGKEAKSQQQSVVDGELIDEADPDNDAILCDGSRLTASGQMTIERDGATYGLCPVCTRWDAVTDQHRMVDHATDASEHQEHDASSPS